MGTQFHFKTIPNRIKATIRVWEESDIKIKKKLPGKIYICLSSWIRPENFVISSFSSGNIFIGKSTRDKVPWMMNHLVTGLIEGHLSLEITIRNDLPPHWEVLLSLILKRSHEDATESISGPLQSSGTIQWPRWQSIYLLHLGRCDAADLKFSLNEIEKCVKTSEALHAVFVFSPPLTIVLIHCRPLEDWIRGFSLCFLQQAELRSPDLHIFYSIDEPCWIIKCPFTLSGSPH